MSCNHEMKNLVYDQGVLKCKECHKTWAEIILGNEENYNESIIKDYNFIIAYEYFKLKTLIENKQIYGAMFQIKDIYEILLRIPVLIFASIVNQDTSADDQTTVFLVTLTQKKHSLGDWRSYLVQAEKLLKQYKNTIEVIHNIVSETVVFASSSSGVDKIDIVHWRNKTIGHGALMLEDDSSMYDDLQVRLMEITEFLMRIKDSYSQIMFRAKGRDYSYLIGYSSLFTLKDEKLEIIIKNFGTIYPASFFKIFNNGIYLYDSFISRKSLVDMIEFPKGKREMFATNDFAQLIDKLPPAMASSSIHDDIYYAEEKEIGEKVLNIEDFVEPRFLVNWLEDIIESKSKISMIQMGKGMGKSTFIRALDPFSMNKIHIPNTSIRTYYVNSSFGSKVYEFQNTLYEIFSHDDNRGKRSGRIPYLNIESDSPGKELSRVLNQAKSSFFQNVNLIFILDGLDELKEQIGNNIIDFIPSDTSLLDEGIFIVITSRTPDKSDGLYGYNMECLERFDDVPKFTLDVESDEYVEFKQQYLEESVFGDFSRLLGKKRITFDLTAVIRETISESMRYESILYLRQYKELVSLRIHNELVQGAREIEPSILHVDMNLLEDYFTTIKSKYGDKYFNKFVQILMILIVTNDSLTIDDLANLIENGNSSFGFLSFINSIRMFLSASRSPRGNTFRVSHIENIQFLKAHLIDNLKQTLSDLFSQIKDLTPQFKFEYNDSQTMVFLAYFFEVLTVADECGHEMYEEMKAYFAELFLNLPIKMDWSLNEPQVEWSVKFLQGLKLFYNKELKGKSNEYDVAYYKILSLLGFTYFLKRFLNDSIEHLEEAFQIADDHNLTSEETIERYLDFTGVLIYSYVAMDMPERGYPVIEQSSKEIQKIIDAGYKVKSKKLGLLDSIKASLYIHEKQFDKAYALFKEAVPKYSFCETNEDVYDYGHVHFEVGRVAVEVGDYDVAEVYLKKSLEIRDQLFEETGYRKTNYYFYRVQKSLSKLKYLQGDFVGSLDCMNTSIQKIEELDVQLELTNKSLLLEILYSKAKLELELKLIQNAEETIDKATNYFSHLHDSEKKKYTNVKIMQNIENLKTILYQS